MKNIVFLLSIVIIIFSCQSVEDSPETNFVQLELDDYDYFEAEIPYDETRYQSRSNHDKVAALGRILFYDNRLSQNNSISCANCHNQENGFSDNKRFSRGVKNFETGRNSMALTNNAYQISHFWEGHSGRIEKHILNPISNHIEMGMKNVDELVTKLSEIENYNDLFMEVYNEAISEELIENALTTFVASLISYNSKFDKGKDIDFVNFTANELAGKDLFFGKANCGQCHKGEHYTASWRRSTNIGLDLDYEDEGAGEGKFKVPTLRNIALTGPYMHDGRFETLEEVVEHYTSGIKDHPELDWILQDKIDLSDTEKKLVIEFLHTLTDYQITTDPKFSSPF